MTDPFRSFFEPGQIIQHPEWCWGQVHSAVGERVTVNFQHQGKVLIDASLITLRLVPRTG